MSSKRLGPNYLHEELFTAPGVGSVIETDLVFRAYSLQVAGVGAAATGWLVVLEGSLDGVNFCEILTHATGDGDGKIYFSGNQIFPAQYMRPRVASLTLGAATGITVNILGAI